MLKQVINVQEIQAGDMTKGLGGIGSLLLEAATHGEDPRRAVGEGRAKQGADIHPMLGVPDANPEEPAMV